MHINKIIFLRRAVLVLCESDIIFVVLSSVTKRIIIWLYTEIRKEFLLFVVLISYAPIKFINVSINFQLIFVYM